MLGTKLLLLSFVAYVSGQGVAYYGSSNVRTQSRVPPRPLRGPVRPPQPIQPTPGPQPGAYPTPLGRKPPQITYFPDSHPSVNGKEPESVTPAPEIPRPVYTPISSQPTIPIQPAPRPLNPRPLQPWAWKPARTPAPPAEDTTPVDDKAQFVYPETSSAPPSYVSKEVDLEPEIGSTPQPDVELVPKDEKELPPLSAETSSDTDINLQPEHVTELNPEMMFPLVPELIPIPDETPIDPISKPDQPTLYPEQPTLYPTPLIPVPSPAQPIRPENYPNPRPLPPASRPLPTLQPVISPEPKPITPESVIPTQTESLALQPNTQPLEPPKPVVDDLLEYLPSRPNQPMPPPRPNYKPTPYEPVTTSTSRPTTTLMPYAPRPNYQPLAPRPRPIPAIPNLASPSTTLIPPTPYPTVPTQPPTQPTTNLPIVIPTSNVPLVEPEIISIIPIHDFECRKGNGYYSIVNECDTYIVCQSRGTFKHTCPDGLHFNPQALYPEYPCAYPSEVKCDSTAAKQIARPTNQCPNRYGFFPISGGDCSKYLMCQEGMATVMNCPFGLVFNENLSSCDWPENVPQCNSNVFKDFTCPIPPADDPDILTKFRYGSDCGMYVACQRGHPRLLRCDAGLSFDEGSQVCMDSDFVPSCRIPIPIAY